MTPLTLVVAILLAQAQPEPEPALPEDPALRAAVAAERAAIAAEKAAEAAQRAAEAAARLAPAVAPPPAAPAVEKPPAGATWASTANLSLISITGNATSLAVNLVGSVERKSEDWIFNLRLTGAYGQAKAQETGETQTTALNGSAQVRAARRFTRLFSGYLLAGIDTDHVASIEERPYGEAGVGLLWLDEFEGKLSKLKLNTDLAFRYGHEFRFQYFPTPLGLDGVIIAAPRFAVSFRYALTKDVIFTEDADVMPNVVGDTRVLADSITKLAARIVAPLSLTAAFQVVYDSRPAAGKVTTDTTLSVGVEVAL